MVSISVSKTSPSVTFTGIAEHYSSDVAGNRSRVRGYVRAAKGPANYFLSAGSQVVSIDGVGTLGSHSANPFLPQSGPYANGWNDGPFYLWVDHDADGTCSVTVRMALDYGSVNESHTATLVLPTIPQTPTSLTVTRVSDSQHTLNWSKVGVTTGAVVQRRTDDGVWQQIAAPSGNVTSFSDTTTVANRKYEYRVAGKAAAGQSAWSNTATVYTTPAAPTGVSAVRDGADIVVSASTVPPHATSFDVEDDGDVVASGVSLPWTDVAPNPAVPHTYKVRGKVGSLTGAWSAASNTVQLLTPPNAPVGLSPNGGVAASDEDVPFTWVHNPVDSSSQTEYELRHRVPEGSWTILDGTTDSERDVSLPVGVHEWQVRTKGSHPDWGAWSATATVDVIDRPGVAVTQPDGSWDASVLTVEWSYLQNQSRPQSAWEARLTQGGAPVEERQGSGAGGSTTFTTRLTEGPWTVEVRAATGSVWSDWASETFAVEFDPPAVPSLIGEWDESQGGVSLTVGPQSDEELPDTVRVLLERNIGGEWETVIEVTELSSLMDWESLTYGDTTYRATAFTIEGATAEAVIVVEARSETIWLNGGAGYEVAAPLPFDPVVSVSAGRARALKQYAGRSLPVPVTGEAVSRVVSVSGRVIDRDAPESADTERLEQIAQSEADLFLFRDPDGRRIYGQIGVIALDREGAAGTGSERAGIWAYSFTLTEATR